VNLGELIDRFRIETGDKVPNPYKASHDDVVEFANDAQNEACRRANLITDTTTDAICRIDLYAGESSYDIDKRVIRVKKARLTNKSLPLDMVSWRDMDEANPGWETHTGYIIAFVQDAQTGKMVFYRIPDATAVAAYPEAWLTVSRLPMAEMVEDGDEPEINPRYHRALLHWMKYRYYTMDDPDVEDDKRAAKWEEKFIEEFGPASRAIDEEWSIRNEGYDPYDGSK